jgi:hypothetical protein
MGTRLFKLLFPHAVASYLVALAALALAWGLRIAPVLFAPVILPRNVFSDVMKIRYASPHHLLAAVPGPCLYFAAFLTTRWLCSSPERAARNRERRRLNGLCANCGYDLRASRRRCPECGADVNRHR